MQVSENTTKGLKRELEVVVEASELERRLNRRLEELKAQVRLPGFRPGKVPVAHLRRVHGKAVMADVVKEAVSETSQKALEEREERPATQPEINLAEGSPEIEELMEGKSDLAYTISFEVVPEFEVMDFSKLSLVRQRAPVEDTTVDEAIQRIADQNREYRTKEGRAEKGDRVIIDFVGRIDGEPFEGGSATDAALELGSESFVPGFEDQLEGAAAGDRLTVKITFPGEYPVPTLAGRPAEFDVTVKEITEAQEARADDELAKRLGLSSIEEMRANVRDQIEKEDQRVSDEKLKRQVLDAIDEGHRFDLPDVLVDQEFELIWDRVKQEMERTGTSFADEGTTEEAARDDYRRIAERRVRLGLVLGEVGRGNDIEVSDDELTQALMQKVREFPGQEQQVYEFYQKNPLAMAELRGPIFEQKAVDHIVSLAKVEEKTVSRDELYREPDDDEAPAQEEKKPAAKAAKGKAKKTAAKPAKAAGKSAKGKGAKGKAAGG